MADLFREQPILRLVIGSAFVVFVWALYLVRVIFGVGTMHDYDGNQAPMLHYLAGALIVTGMVTVWIVVRAIMMRHQKRSEDSK